MLTLDALTIRQGDFSLTADWSVAPAERVAIIGPSGGGKSTLLMTIAGFIPLTSGRLLWQGRGLGGVPPGPRAGSMLFQGQNLFPHLTVAQNLGLGLSSDLRLTSVQVDQVESALRRVGLEGMGERKPSELSGGQQGRGALGGGAVRGAAGGVVGRGPAPPPHGGACPRPAAGAARLPGHSQKRKTPAGGRGFA